MKKTMLATLLMTLSGIAAAADKPKDLQAEMVKLEKEFYALYNQLNTDDQYDVICTMEAQTGSRREVRVCQPQYLLNAKAAAAGSRVQSAISGGISEGSANTRGPDVGNSVPIGAPVELTQEQAFRKNIMDVLQKSPELQALGQKRDELQVRYDAVTKGSSSR